MAHSKNSQLATILFVVLLVLLHVLKPDIEPTWRFISEYGIGRFGWLMNVAFFCWAAAYLFMFLALRKYLKTIVGRIGLGLLLLSTAGLVLAGIFTTDPATATEPTTNGELHNLGGSLLIAAPFAILLVSIAMLRNLTWTFSKAPFVLSTILALIGFLVSAISLGVILSATNGKVSPDTWVGIPTRFEVLTYCIWLIVAARCVTRLTANRHAEVFVKGNVQMN